MIPEDTRGQGFKDSSGMLKNYRDLKAWKKSYELYLDLIEKVVLGTLKKTYQKAKEC